MKKDLGMVVATLFFFGGASLLVSLFEPPAPARVNVLIGIGLIVAGILIKRRLRDDQRAGYKAWMQTYRNVIIAMIVIVIGELLPPMRALEEWIVPQRTELAWQVGYLGAAGFVIFMGAVLYRIFTGGGSLSREEIERTIKSVNDGLERPYASRVSKYWVPKKAWGAGFSDQMTMREFKEAWRLQLWRKDSRWRGVFLMAIGALLMTIGIFGMPIVLGPPGIKFFCGLTLGYALVRTFLALLKA